MAYGLKPGVAPQLLNMRPITRHALFIAIITHIEISGQATVWIAAVHELPRSCLAVAIIDPFIWNPDLSDCRAPTFSDVPDPFHNVLIEHADGPNPFGFNGLWEGASIGAGVARSA